MIKYRPEIDGLRAIAVLAVIIYHLDVFFGKNQFLKGGFFGVDVFFVISGFLITTIIMDEYHRMGSFSIINFYERRARRILPALFTIILISFPFAWTLLQPSQTVDFSKSILSSLAFGSNFYWNSSLQAYGAESALLKPFLHTWSLAVEEQYYVIFPLILIAIYKWSKPYTIAILTGGFLVSLQFSETMSANDASFSFYMLPSRSWELLSGSLLANRLYFHPQKENGGPLNHIMPVLGLLLITYSMVFIGLESNHPGFITLIPVIGTIIIIWFANKNTLITKMLSGKLFIGVGLISYSLYLWHYPIFAFGRVIDATPDWHDKFQWVVLTFLLSVLTYIIIEKPFRNRVKISRLKFLFSLLITTVIIISVTVSWIKTNGNEKRLGGYLSKVLKDSSRVWVTQNNQKCHSGGGGRKPVFPLSESCVFEYNSGAEYIIAIGDSHAASMSENLRWMAEINDRNFLQLTSAGCSHIKGLQDGICGERADQLVKFLEKYSNSTIIYSSRVPLVLEMEKFDNGEGDKEANYKPAFPKEKDEFRFRSEAFLKTLNELKSVSNNFVIVYPVPEQGFNVQDKIFSGNTNIHGKHDLPSLSTSYKIFKSRVIRSYQTLDKIIGNNVYRIYPEYLFCSETSGRCTVSEKDKIFFASDNHVSPLGSHMIVKEVANNLSLKFPTIPPE